MARVRSMSNETAVARARGALLPAGPKFTLRPVQLWPTRRRLGLVALLPSLLHPGCRGGLELEAAEVYVTPGATFNLLARLPGLTWTWSGSVPAPNAFGLEQVTPPAVLATFTAPAGPEDAKVQVESGGASAEAKIRLTPTGSGVEVPQEVGARPAVVLFNPSGGAEVNCSPRVVAVAGRVPELDDVRGCTTFVLFPGAQGAPEVLPWGASAAAVQTWSAVPVVNVRFLRAERVSTDPKWREWWRFALEVFDLNRVGITFVEDYLDTPPDLEGDWSPGNADCSALLRCHGAKGAVTVMFASSIVPSTTRGVHCADPADPATALVLISMVAGSHDVLVHELAHSLGLDDELESRVGKANIMSRPGPKPEARARAWFTVGQLFRMHFSDSSAVGRVNPQKRTCPAECPPVDLDLPRGK